MRPRARVSASLLGARAAPKTVSLKPVLLANREGFWDSPTSAAIGVLSVVVLACGQNAQPKPECHQRRDPRHERETGLLVLTAGPVAYFSTGVTHHPVAASLPGECSGVLALFLRAALKPRTGRPQDDDADRTRSSSG